MSFQKLIDRLRRLLLGRRRDFQAHLEDELRYAEPLHLRARAVERSLTRFETRR